MASLTEKEWNELKNNPDYQLFRKYVAGWNFITPQPVKYIKKGKYVIEISKEEHRIMSEWLYGITIVDLEKGSVDNELSKCLMADREEDAYKQCIDYINELT